MDGFETCVFLSAAESLYVEKKTDPLEKKPLNFTVNGYRFIGKKKTSNFTVNGYKFIGKKTVNFTVKGYRFIRKKH